MQRLTLADLKEGESAEIASVAADSNSQRLNEMGLVSGQSVTIVNKALWGDPIEIRIMNYQLCLRKADAAQVFLKTQ